MRCAALLLLLIPFALAFKILGVREVQQSAVPAIESTLTSKGIEFANKYARAKIVEYLQEKTTYNWRSTTPNGKLAIQNLYFDQVDDANLDSKVSVAENHSEGLTWKVTGLSLSGKGILSSTLPFILDQDKSNVTIQLKNLNINLAIKSDMQSGRLIGHQVTCDIDFDTSQLVLDKPLSKSDQQTVDDQLGVLVSSNLCDRFRRTLSPQMHNRIFNIPLDEHMYDAFYLNAQLTEPLKYTDASIQGLHKGIVYTQQFKQEGSLLQKANQLPFKPGRITSQATDTERMVVYKMSNYTIASLFYWMDQLRQFDYVIDKNTKAAGFNSYMLTECDDDLCAGGFFPSLRKEHPRSEVVINSPTSTYPTVLFEEDGVKVIIDGTIASDVYPLDEPESSKRKQWLTAKMQMHCEIDELKLTDENYLVGDLKMTTYDLKDIESPLKDVGSATLDLIVSSIIDSVVRPDLKNKFRRGIRLPKILEFKSANSKISVTDSTLIVGTDYCSTKMTFAPCSEITTNSTSSIDDYYEDDLFSRFGVSE